MPTFNIFPRNIYIVMAQANGKKHTHAATEVSLSLTPKLRCALLSDFPMPVPSWWMLGPDEWKCLQGKQCLLKQVITLCALHTFGSMFDPSWPWRHLLWAGQTAGVMCLMKQIVCDPKTASLSNIIFFSGIVWNVHGRWCKVHPNFLVRWFTGCPVILGPPKVVKKRIGML